MADYKWLEQKSDELLHAHVRLREAANRATRPDGAPDTPTPAEMREFEQARTAYLRLHDEWLELIGHSV